MLDSGSTDGTLEILSTQPDVELHRHPFETHARQMNRAIALASHDWVFCLDSDEFVDDGTAAAVRALQTDLHDPTVAYRIRRHWRVLGREVRALYPVSSPDRPVRLFNRTVVRFNDRPVDDSPVGFVRCETLPGHVVHETFHTLDEMVRKLNGYTSRLVRHRPIRPSLLAGVLRAPPAFLKWYLRKGAWRDGAVGLVTGAYAACYTFLKYAKAWERSRLDG